MTGKFIRQFEIASEDDNDDESEEETVNEDLEVGVVGGLCLAEPPQDGERWLNARLIISGVCAAITIACTLYTIDNEGLLDELDMTMTNAGGWLQASLVCIMVLCLMVEHARNGANQRNLIRLCQVIALTVIFGYCLPGAKAHSGNNGKVERLMITGAEC